MVTLSSNKSSYQEPHAFDLTWRNYLPSISQFCCCFQTQIRLEDEDTVIEPAYYNDLRRESFDTTWEFESVLGQNDIQFVTGNPFGTVKKRTKKKRQPRPDVIMEIESAEFLAEDQIAHLAYNRHSKNMDQYGEEVCYNRIQGPIVQEMQAPDSFTLDSSETYNSADTLPSNLMKNVGSSKKADRAKKNRLKSENTHDTRAALTAYQVQDDISIPSLTDNAPFVSDQHPFTYFENHTQSEQEEPADRNVFNLGKRIFG
ncbi:hypothetical protein CU098_003661 [Rhizopus stolonifer]|uniref:Uncharacterized protein n=1 Tax=Rhizopus stolonifer TaxID=4846 RepID=A0A367ILQ8_RHIST|nr:hypothetical protein CU098_003661 [Rhizopus stolonifer]